MNNSTPSNLIDVKELLEAITKECIEKSNSYRPAKLSNRKLKILER